MTNGPYDLVVIGGGINGAGIAADAAGRGLSVLLAEAGDLACGTSSASSKLIHGGLRYLEHYEFRLVREALGERELLMAKAPHIIWPLRFVLPHVPSMRSPLVLRAGLFLYDHLAARHQLGASHTIDLAHDPAGTPLRSEFARGFTYYDCWVDDARLVVANALAAKAHGAEVMTRTPVTGLAVEGGGWTVRLGERAVRAKAIVNAAGPWVEQVARMVMGPRNEPPPKVRLIKGSHIVVPRLSEGTDAYIFQNDDGRVVFALPFEGAFTLIGTTDVPFHGDPRDMTVTDDEEAYLLRLAARFFRKPPAKADIVWRFAGVRPLDDDGASDASAVSRDYRLELDAAGGAPVLHVLGGKVTTYRKLAESALATLEPFLEPRRGPWTAAAPLPGGNVGVGGYANWFEEFAARHAGFPRTDLERLARRYGTRTERVLNDAGRPADLGPALGGGLTHAEVIYLRDQEWAKTAEDVLWRRTKAGLHMSASERLDAAERIERLLS